jgi:hypothetical protein
VWWVKYIDINRDGGSSNIRGVEIVTDGIEAVVEIQGRVDVVIRIMITSLVSSNSS